MLRLLKGFSPRQLGHVSSRDWGGLLELQGADTVNSHGGQPFVLGQKATYQLGPVLPFALLQPILPQCWMSAWTLPRAIPSMTCALLGRAWLCRQRLELAEDKRPFIWSFP